MDASRRIEMLREIDQHLTPVVEIVEKCTHEVGPIHNSVKE
jgi:hypothetical protein